MSLIETPFVINLSDMLTFSHSVAAVRYSIFAIGPFSLTIANATASDAIRPQMVCLLSNILPERWILV